MTIEIGKLYKVRSKKSGEYCSGSKHGSLSFTAKGKTWNHLGHVKSMLSQFKRDIDKDKFTWTKGHSYDDLEVAVFEVSEVEVMNASDIMKSK